MFSKLFGKNKLNPADLEKLLAQARRHLWRNDLAKAKELFDQVRSEIKTQVQNDSSTAKLLSKPNLEVQLGLWAIRYLQDQNYRGAIQKVLERSDLDADIAYFIAKVFQSREDVSPQALESYKSLLRFDTSVKVVKRIAELLQKVDYSDIALQLLSSVVGILSDDISLESRLCRWYLIAGQDNDACELAYQIIRQQPQNVDANRCLALIAERNNQWLKANEYYKVAGDNLRSAVVLCRAKEFDEAQKMVMSVSLYQRATPTWLYFHGWIAFNQNNFSIAFNSWHKLMHEYPDRRDLLIDVIQVAQDRMLYEQLTSFEVNTELAQEFIDGSPYQAAVALQIGATKLLRDDDVIGALPLLEQSVQLNRGDVCANTYLMLAKSLEKDSETADKQIYQQLFDNFKDASLFMWLRGLYLLRDGKSRGFNYLKKANHDGIHKYHIPADAVAVAKWVGSRVNNSQSIDENQDADSELNFAITGEYDLTTPFRRAAVSSYTLYQMQDDKEILWIDLEAIYPINPSIWSKIQTAFYLRRNDWHGAVTSVDGTQSTLKQRIISAALQDASKQQDWSSAAEYVSLGLEIDPNNQKWLQIQKQLRPQMRQNLWKQRQLEQLDFELEKQIRSGTADTSIYHGMAVVYTRLAIAKDKKAAENESSDGETVFTMAGHRTQSEYTGILEDEGHNDYWQLAIGYWAVTLTDESYWEAWAKHRGRILGETITPDQIRELTQQTIPQMLHTYHDDEIHRGSTYTTHHRFYRSILEHEFELTQAMRYLIRVAERQQFKLPSGFITMFISPLLMKEYGYESQGRDIVARLGELRLSPYEAGLIRTAFSPISDVKALVSIHAYDMALGTLRKLMADKKYTAIRTEILQELCHVLELSAAEAVALERWDDALALSAEGKKLQPMNKEFVRLTLLATMGWANNRIHQEEYMEAILQLESVHSNLKKIEPELEALLCEAYIEWAYEAARDEDNETALIRFENAIRINPHNERAKGGLNIAYYLRAVTKVDDHQDYSGALNDVEIALKYDTNDLETYILKVRICYMAAINASNASNLPKARQYWSAALETARKCWTLQQSIQVLKLGVAVKFDYMMFQYKTSNYFEAIQIGEELYSANYDSSVLDADLPKILSGLYTELGAEIYNSGNYAYGKQLTQKALQYDPTNQVARNNLYT